MRFLLVMVILTVATAAQASCPAPKDITEEQTALLEAAQSADNAGDGQRIGNALWRLWATAPNEQAQQILDDGMRARNSYNFVAALDIFDQLVKDCPDYAEGYNQRAFVHFLRERFEPALEDLDRALKRNPRHVAALTGKALTLMGLKRHDEAQQVLRKAVALNPWVPERGLLKKPDGVEL